MTKFTTIRVREDIIGTIADSGGMIANRRRDSSLEIATGCASIRTMNRTGTTKETKNLIRRAAMTQMIEVSGEMTGEIRQHRTGGNSELPRSKERQKKRDGLR
jgi:hypothetical protein